MFSIRGLAASCCGGEPSRTWPGSVELLVVPAGAFLFAWAIEGCFSSWNGECCCWDLSFLDAQTGSMNSMKMAMKVGTQFSSNNQKIQPFTLWREGAIYTPSPF